MQTQQLYTATRLSNAVANQESYSRSIAPRATPGLLHRELLPVYAAPGPLWLAEAGRLSLRPPIVALPEPWARRLSAYSWFGGLVWGAFYTMFQAGPAWIGRVLGPRSANNRPKSAETKIPYLSFRLKKRCRTRPTPPPKTNYRTSRETTI